MVLSSNSLSSVELVRNTVRRNTNDFDFSTILGSFVNNRDFAQGFLEYAADKNTTGSEIWNALSVIGQETGEVIYEAVLNYIDEVSNSDTCKLQTLKSMLTQLGFEYTVFDQYRFMPAEVQQVVDLMSISPSYLFLNKFMQDDFAQALCADGVISPYDAVSDFLSAYDYPVSAYDGMSSDVVDTDLSTFIYDENAFTEYVSGIYRTLLGGFLTMTYNNADRTPVYKTVDEYDSYFPEDAVSQPDEDSDYARNSYKSFKVANDIDLSFDPVQIVDRITAGRDSFSNYSGAKLELLKKEYDYRNANLYDFLRKSVREKLLSSFTDEDMLVTRGSYYRKQKMLEYARFIDMKWYMAHKYLSSAVEYSYDRNYYEIKSDHTVTDTVVKPDAENGIDWSMVEYVAKSLTRLTMFIHRLREMIRLQTRKNYMRGTANLVKFVVNELLVEYSRYNEHFLDESGDTDQDLSVQFGMLSSHDIDDVQVEEYWDKTEYFNIETDNSGIAVNSEYVNSRYFDGLDSDPGRDLPAADIAGFYLDCLNTRQKLRECRSDENSADEDNLHDFLKSVFKIGADASFVDSRTGKFHSSFQDGYTYEYDSDLKTLALVYANTVSVQNEYGYSFDSSKTIEEQVEDYLAHAKSCISSLHYQNVYTVSTDTAANIQRYRRDIDALSSNFASYIEGTYKYYFTKYENQNCYDEDGEYIYPYFVDNPMFGFDTIYGGIGMLNSYVKYDYTASNLDVTGTIHNWAMLATLKQISSSYESNLTAMQELVQSISGYGYTYLDVPNLGTEFENISGFLETLIDRKYTELTAYRELFKDEIQTIQNRYDQIMTEFTEMLNNAPNMYLNMADNDTVGQYYTHKHNGGYIRRSDTSDKADITDQYSGAAFQKKSGHGEFEKKRWNAQLLSYNDSFYQKTEKLIKIITEDKEVFYGDNSPQHWATCPTHQGVYEISARYGDVESSISALAKNVIEKFGLDEDSGSEYIKNLFDAKNNILSGDLADKIQTIKTAITVGITDSIVRNEGSLIQYDEYLASCTVLSSRYDQDMQTYQQFSTNQDYYEFLDGYTPGDDYIPYNMSNLSVYILKKDSQNLDQIRQDIADFYTMYDEILSGMKDSFNTVEFYRGDGQYRKYVDIAQGDEFIENIITDFVDCVEVDVKYRKEDADVGIQRDVDSLEQNIENSYDIIARRYLNDPESENDGYRSVKQLSGGTFDALVLGLCSKLNYFASESYNLEKELWPSYIGTEDAYDPYYNIKNKTHPSFQVHPFLWKFIRYTSHMQNDLEKVFVGARSDMFESDRIVQNIDRQIGCFGQVVDKWLGTTNCDFTAYTTRYESNDNIPDNGYGNTPCEVVSYDGCFYPPALEMLLADPKTCLADLTSDTHAENGFYDRYFKHLGLSRRALAEEAAKIEKSLNVITDVAADHLPEDVYDIYKYAIDKYGNSFILYKRYGKKDPTVWEKRDTPGCLWVREKDHPIGLPVFVSGDVDVYSDSHIKFEDCQTILAGYFRYYYANKTTDFFYDFEMTDMQNAILLASVNFYEYDFDEETGDPITYEDLREAGGLKSYRGTYQDPRCRRCNQCVVVPVVLDRRNAEDGEPELYFTMTGSDILAMNEHYISDGRHYTYVGMHASNDIARAEYTKVVFIERTDGEISQSGTLDDVRIPDDPLVKILTYYNNKWLPSASGGNSTCRLSGLSGITLDQTVFAFYNDPTYGARLDMAFVQNNADGKVVADLNGLSVDMEADSEGAAMGDPQSDTYNAYDTFNQNVVVATLAVNQAGRLRVVGDTLYGNMNADMSYTPGYPSYEKALDISERLTFGDMQSVEALGNSVPAGRLRAAVDSVNPNPDPYIDIGDLEAQGCFGRVYEDWKPEADKTITWDSCPEMCQNSQYFSDGRFEWKSDRLTEFANGTITKDDLSKMTLMIFNMKSYGQNPYLVCSLSDLFGKGEIPVSYDEVPREDAAYELSGMSTPGGWMQVVGTSLSGYEINKTASNNIFNIGGITVEAECETAAGNIVSKCGLTLRFKLTDPRQPCYIEQDDIKIVAVNRYDLTRFEFYHYLDNYGTVLSDSAGEYFVCGNGQKMYLENIDFSKYDRLSDIAALVGNKNLAFKYSEEDRFAVDSILYYTPGLNCKYPLTQGQYYLCCNTLENVFSESDPLSGLFDSRNLFIVDPDVAGRLSCLGLIDVPTTTGEREACRVYEDFLETDAAQGQPLWKEYDPDNAEFYEYVHFAGEISQQYNPNRMLDVENRSYVSYRTGDEFVNSMIRDYNISAMNGEGHMGSYSSFDSRDTVRLDQADVDALGKFANIYACYDYTDEDGITLYFNYTNYLHSPFLKVESNNVYIDTINGSYLKLKPGEDGQLDIIIQFQRYFAHTLAGVRNICVASYRIYNVSDDKPKFVVKKLFECGPASKQEERPLYDLIVSPEKKDVLVPSKVNTLMTTGEDRLVPDIDESNNKFEYIVDFTYSVENKSTTSIILTIFANNQVLFEDSDEMPAGVEKLHDNQLRISTAGSRRFIIPMRFNLDVPLDCDRNFPVYADIESSDIEKSQIKAGIGYLKFNLVE